MVFLLKKRSKSSSMKTILEKDTAEILRELTGGRNGLVKYLHNTAKETIAQNIMHQGFRFEKYLENSTELVSGNDLVELRYFIQTRKSYGSFTVVLCIAHEIVHKYSDRLEGSGYHYTEALTLQEPVLSADDELVFTLPPQFTKGYLDQKKGKITTNPKFNPHFDSPVFMQNIKKLLSQ